MPKKDLDIEHVTDNPAVNLALDTVKINKQALVFLGTRPSSEKSAEDIAKRINFGSGKGEEIRQLSKLAEDILHAIDSPTRQCERLSRCIRKGIAFHHSGLTAKQRELIETNFRNGVVKIICCTPTLAAGVDLPAYRAIIRDLKRFTQHGYDWIPVLEYHQMSGRAGRPNFDKEGQAIIFAGTEGQADELADHFIHGKPEEILSKLSSDPVLRTYLLSLIATRIVTNKPEILSFFEKTFWAHQFKQMRQLEKRIDKMLQLLEKWEFLKSGNKSDFTSAADLDKGKIIATLLGSRVAQLYLDPLTAHNLIDGLKSTAHKGLTPFTLLQLISYTLELAPLLRVKVKEQETIQAALLEHQMNLLTQEPSVYESDYEEFLASVKTALFFQDWISENTEDHLLEKYGIRPGETRSKLARADWLLYSLGELARILQLRQELKETAKLRIRLKYGVNEELLPLLQLKNIGRVRSRRLFNNRIRTIADVKKTDISTLTQLLGSFKIALDVKKQVGQEVKQLRPGKRKGQTSIAKY